MREKLKFEVVEHTADIGIKVYGKDLVQLYENAAYGMFSLLTDLKKVKPDKKLKISVQGSDIESLLINWLNELIYLQVIKKMVFLKFNINKYEKSDSRTPAQKGLSLSAEVSGEKINPLDPPLYFEIKAATYHQLEIKKTPSGYETQIIFDV